MSLPAGSFETHNSVKGAFVMKFLKENLSVILLTIVLVRSLPIEEISHMSWAKPVKLSDMFK